MEMRKGLTSYFLFIAFGNFIEKIPAIITASYSRAYAPWCGIWFLLAAMFTTSLQSKAQVKGVNETMGSTVTIKFTHTVKGNPLVLDDSSYTNPSGETYTVHKLKYYVGQLQFFNSADKAVGIKGYFLINHSADSSCSIRLVLPEGDYNSLQFLIGVDSAMNSAGAQTGALDPLNDMYWTWQSGYIMQKLEGTSPQSNVVNNKIEYHLGGYAGANSTQRLVKFEFAKERLISRPGGSSIVRITADLDKFWQGQRKVTIRDTPVCSTTGSVANQLSYNFAGMLSFLSVTNN